MILSELVAMRGFDLSKRIKLVRHQDSNYDTKHLYSHGLLDFYQSVQSKDVFGNCEYILSFLGYERSMAIYIGAYKVLSKSQFDRRNNNVPENYPYMEILDQPLFHYQLQKVDLLNDLIDRMVIDWGNATRSWYQWLSNSNPKQVIEILPSGYVKEFPGFDDLILTFDELYTIVNSPDSNRTWHTMLSSVAGVYLITDMTNGSQYVGSASGERGIMGRWRGYTETPHGGNINLISLLQADPDRYRNFQYSILRTLPKSLTRTEVIGFEKKYKQKLGSRAFGLNGN
ncbi:GIY-YIG nuclease family protein [Paenibacillus cellulositrophicus]|uniref:GIY-YIG nuclease family protein n=1 Tax=Paenibacillus cellulositrophicus TaxID=562959 RepID=UPI00203CAB9D|nr:GIY-YIG nuclease family protein [Paenibacillus cellulositrophicus]MCM2999970.1 GIY-YIG nuclease family protein [Paenibacillus cellulositrophicus]